MTSRHRIARAMTLGAPDRVPVMCQLAIGHYFLHSGVDPLAIWFTSEGFAEALIRMQERYRFDGILVNLPGREADVLDRARRVERVGAGWRVHWPDGSYTDVPPDDLPHHFPVGGVTKPAVEALDPEQLWYIEPWDVTEVSYPFRWGFEEEARPVEDFFPSYHFDTIRRVREQAAVFSVHSEVFSPWSQWLDLVGYEAALMALVDDPAKVHTCLARLAEGAADLARRQAACGVDAVLISSAFAGAGFISRRHYAEFVLPVERVIVEAVKSAGTVVYTHTCGAIGDRLDLMLETGTMGIDTLDPPPLGTVELEDAKRMLAGRAFIKGNIDPVHVLLAGPLDRIDADVRRRLTIGMAGGGYILSTACSVAPHTPPAHIARLAELAEAVGRPD